MNERKLIEKLRLIEALYGGAKTAGEQDAAVAEEAPALPPSASKDRDEKALHHAPGRDGDRSSSRPPSAAGPANDKAGAVKEVSRNAPCPGESGKKFKKCCGRKKRRR